MLIWLGSITVVRIEFSRSHDWFRLGTAHNLPSWDWNQVLKIFATSWVLLKYVVSCTGLSKVSVCFPSCKGFLIFTLTGLLCRGTDTSYAVKVFSNMGVKGSKRSKSQIYASRNAWSWASVIDSAGVAIYSLPSCTWGCFDILRNLIICSKLLRNESRISKILTWSILT